LVTPTSGQSTIGGRAYRDLDDPTRTVGASLEATSFHPGRTAHDHLRVIALAAGIPAVRVGEVLLQTGLIGAAGRRVGTYSLGMRQRLALAAALLGDPQVLVLDEPANGLDPEGIIWLRGFLRHLAAEGRAVLISSHVLAEVEQTVDEVIVIARGRLVRQAPLAELRGQTKTLVRTPDGEQLLALLQEHGRTAAVAGTEATGTVLEVEGTHAVEVGRIACANGIELHELRTVQGDLEDVFLELTRESS
jgi:ABC-2 type transport system ATP-binding protein